MKNPEFGDIIITNNGKRWVCADVKTIREKVRVNPDAKYFNNAIKAYAADLKEFSFMTWKSVDSTEDSWDYRIKEVISSTKRRADADLIVAWADGATIQARVVDNNGKQVWVDVDPKWYDGREYRIKPADEIKIVEIRRDLTRTTRNAVSDGNHLEITFDADSGIIKSVKII